MIQRVFKAVLVLTVGASIAVSLLGLIRQKAVASIIGADGLADLSLLLSIAGPVAAFALWPLISFAKDLNNEDNSEYGPALRSAASICMAGFAAGAAFILVLAWRSDAIRYPLGTTEGLFAAIVFALGMVGIGFATSILTFRGDLARWRRLALMVALGQAGIVTILGVLFERRGAVWGMAGVTGGVGAVLLVGPWLRGRGLSFHVPDRWLAFSVANGSVMLTLAAAESSLRQASADFSALIAAYFQASLSIIGAISAGVAQYTAGRLLPVATAARDSGHVGHVWDETKRAALIVGVFVAAACGAIALLAPTILSVAFSSEFDAASPLLRMVIFGEGAVALGTVVTASLLGLGKTSLWATLSIVPAVVRVATHAVLTGSSPTARLGWAYVTAGIVSVVLCGTVYLLLARRDDPAPGELLQDH